MNFKDIHIGQLLAQRVSEQEVDIQRICNFMNSSEEDVKEMYLQKNLHTDVLLKWSKLLEYDFFRVYSQHLILYAPVAAPIKQGNSKKKNALKTNLPQFRKNIYTKEVIDFILEQIKTGKISKIDVLERYRIPKTTLYKWISKYKD